jgi:hypothetical protein
MKVTKSGATNSPLDVGFIVLTAPRTTSSTFD